MLFLSGVHSSLPVDTVNSVQTLDVHLKAPKEYIMGSGFASFLEIVAEKVKTRTGGPSRGAFGHYDMLTGHCDLPQGFEYDYFLKVEQMDLWHDARFSVVIYSRGCY
jgi:hypothetical protein